MLNFTRMLVHGPIGEAGCWLATRDDFSFVINRQQQSGPGFQGKDGFIASWRVASGGAVKVLGSPFANLEAAQQGCEQVLKMLLRPKRR